MRLDRLFTHRLIMMPLASYIGYIAMGIAIWALLAGVVSLWWLVPLIFGILLFPICVSIGMHRLFTHVSYKTNRFWELFLAYIGTLTVYGSTVSWAGMHAAHHRFSDTDKDPHYTKWTYLLWKRNRPTEFNKKVLTRLYQDPIHRFLHKWFVLVVIATVLILALISPWLLIFLYLAPLGWFHLVNGIHHLGAHGGGRPRDRKYLEWFLFQGGEWQHSTHHKKPLNPQLGKFDVGYWIIRLIQTKELSK